MGISYILCTSLWWFLSSVFYLNLLNSEVGLFFFQGKNIASLSRILIIMIFHEIPSKQTTVLVHPSSDVFQFNLIYNSKYCQYFREWTTSYISWKIMMREWSLFTAGGGKGDAWTYGARSWRGGKISMRIFRGGGQNFRHLSAMSMVILI